MIRYAAFGAFLCLIIAPLPRAQQKKAGAGAGDRIELGRLANGADVVFVRPGEGDWGIEISGVAVPRMAQPKPAQIEVYRSDENVKDLAAGYQSVQEEAGVMVARAKVADGGDAAFAVEDKWMIAGDVLSLDRKVRVTGTEDKAGFYSAIRLATTPAVTWADADYFAPGLLYGDPTYDGDTSPGGELNYHAGRFSMSEDLLSAPLFALNFRDGR